jgi:subtilase family serine protease
MRPRLTLKAIAVIGAGTLAVAVSTTAGFAAPNRVTVAGTKPGWVASATRTGSPSASKRLSVNVILPLRNTTAIQNFVTAVSDPTSPSYGKYLTPAQFNARFGPTAAQVKQVRRYLVGQGLSVTSVAQGNRWVTASGTVAKVSKAFGTTLRTYRYHGQTSLAPTANLTVPSSIAPLIAGVTGIDSISNKHRTSAVKPVANAAKATRTNAETATSKAAPHANSAPRAKPAATPPASQPCSTYWGQFSQTVPSTYGKTKLPTTPCGYGPQDIRKAYGIDGAIHAGDTGRGVVVAITDAYAQPTMLADLNHWSTDHGLPKMKSGQYTQAGTADPSTFANQNPCGGEVGWNEEEALDVEAVHGMAPDAIIHYVGGKDCDTGLDTALNYIVQTHSAEIVSNSWGATGEDNLGSSETLEHSIFMQGAAEGIGFYFSAGDDGDDTIDGFASPEADYPSTDPNVTAVGGTSLAVTKTGSTLFQTSWGDTVDQVNFNTTPATLSEPLPGEFYFGTGGGTSKLFTQPAYQKGVVADTFALKTGVRHRVTPDVALDADPETGYEVALTEPDANGHKTYTSFVIGGTSLSSPLFAGFQALASQGRHVALGFANPVLYNKRATAFTDIVNPATPIAFSTQSGAYVLVLGQDTSLVGIKGFDNTTGLGTPAGLRFLLSERS